MAEREDHDRRWRAAAPGAPAWSGDLGSAVELRYPQLGSLHARVVYSSVHDIAEVVGAGGRYALKLYRPGLRSLEEVRWEVGLQRHLASSGVPAALVVEGAAGLVETIPVEGAERMAVLSEWAPGVKPAPSAGTYRLLGRLAGAIHVAAGTYRPAWRKPGADMDTKVWSRLALLRPLLEEAGRWDEARRLAERLERFVAATSLERGVGHGDLTLDNVHVEGHGIYVFDFDSSREHWRAFEPQGVFHYSVLAGQPWWDHWLAGYTSVRPMPATDQAAVPWFVLMFQFENTAWKLGLTTGSAGVMLRPEELAGVVDAWTAWASRYCRGLTAAANAARGPTAQAG